MSKKLYLLQFACIMIMLALVMGIAGCGGGGSQGGDAVVEEDATANNDVNGVTEIDLSGPTRTPRVLTPGSGVTVLTAADWASEHPDIYAAYMKNANNIEQDDYVANYPWIVTLYDGMGFSKSYMSARGHVYSLMDLDATGRPHAFANCFACKTPDLHALINEQGNEIYQIPYDDLLAQMTEPVSCFNCHANEPGELIVTHKYLAEALGSDINKVAAENLACAQCHIEYYFDPATKVVTPPYTSLATMNPDSILSYFNNLMVDGKPFADYTNTRSGVRQIKVQHPEFETFLGVGSEHGAGNDADSKIFKCADCHMGTAVNAAGETYIDHEWSSPLKNPALIQSTCMECHDDLAADVLAVQTLIKGKTKDVGQDLEDLMEKLIAAVESGQYTDDQLDAIRNVFRNAQFYWDFVFVENSNGAHNPTLSEQCLDKAADLAAEVRTMIEQL